jgi:hypothetical protein
MIHNLQKKYLVSEPKDLKFGAPGIKHGSR